MFPTTVLVIHFKRSLLVCDLKFLLHWPMTDKKMASTKRLREREKVKNRNDEKFRYYSQVL